MPKAVKAFLLFFTGALITLASAYLNQWQANILWCGATITVVAFFAGVLHSEETRRLHGWIVFATGAFELLIIAAVSFFPDTTPTGPVAITTLISTTILAIMVGKIKHKP